jgi:hypothetical protein
VSGHDVDLQEDQELEDDQTVRNIQVGESPSETLPSRQHQESTSSAFGYDPPSIQTQTSTYRRETNENSGSTSLFERTQHNLNQQSYHQKNPIAAYGDPPLPEIDASFVIFPSEATAQALIRKYFDFVSATNRILHRPTVERWTSELLSNIRRMRTGSEENSQRAVVLMLFALTHQYMGDECGDWDINTGYPSNPPSHHTMSNHLIL